MNRLSLQIVGMWANEKTEIISGYKQLIIPLMVLWMIISFLLPINYALVQIMGNVSLVVDNLISNISASVTLIKLSFVWINRKSNKSLLFLRVI